MESIETVNEPKQTTPSPPAADHDGDDRISGLCDDVLARILALTGGGAAELVRTGVLSRRWRGLWTRVPAFRFDSGREFLSPSDAERFIASVNDVLALHAQPDSSGIEQLGISLKVHYAPGEPRLAAATVQAAEGWIRYAVQHELTSFAFAVDVMPEKWLDKYNHEEEEEDDHEEEDEDEDEDEDEEEDNYNGDEGDEDEEEEEDSCSGDEGDDKGVEKEEKGEEEEGSYSTDEGDEKETPEIALDELPSSAKLETMRLFLGGARIRLPACTSVMFASLTDLALECLEIAADSGHLLGRLLSSACCPCLQKLCLWAVTFNKHAMAKDLVIEASTLMELTMYDMGNMNSLELRAPNLRALEIDSCDELKALKVSASRLKELTFSRNCLEAGIHGELPCVELLRINLVSHMSRDSDINDTVISLLKSCSSATRLVVDLDVPSKFERHADRIEDKIPPLPSVTSLSVNIHPPFFEGHSLGDGVAGLLTRFSNLRYLCIQMGDYFSEDADGDSPFFCTHENNDRWALFDDISLANLLTAEFTGLAGTSCELRFLRFILESAMDLEKVTVRFSANNNNLEDLDYFVHELLGDDGAWTACEDRSYEWRL